MNEIQRTAALNTAKTISIAVLCSLIIPVILYLFPIEWICIGFATVLFISLVKLAYTIEVERLTRLKTLNEIK